MDRSKIARSFMAPADAAPVSWSISPDLVDYEDALAIMERRVEAIAAGQADEWVWLLQHPPIYTAGTSARGADLTLTRFPTYQTGRGGQYTYHGPGQRVAYVMLDLRRRKPDVRAFVAALEDWVIAALTAVGVRGERREDRVGVWVQRPGGRGEDKIAALGIRLRHWVSFHGVSINVDPDLTHYAGIIPCGIEDPRLGVTSLAALGEPVEMDAFDVALRGAFEPIFGPTQTVQSETTESRPTGDQRSSQVPAVGGSQVRKRLT